MNLYLRLLWAVLLAKFKGKISLLNDLITHHIVWPNDLDLLGHVNNGRYFTITDYVRMECLIRAGIWRELRKRNILPLMAGETAQFRKPLKPFQRYQIKTRAIGWDERFLYVEHVFSSKRGIHAVLLVKVVLYSAGDKLISMADVLRLSKESGDISEQRLNESIQKWNASSSEHWLMHK